MIPNFIEFTFFPICLKKWRFTLLILRSPTFNQIYLLTKIDGQDQLSDVFLPWSTVKINFRMCFYHDRRLRSTFGCVLTTIKSGFSPLIFVKTNSKVAFDRWSLSKPIQKHIFTIDLGQNQFKVDFHRWSWSKPIQKCILTVDLSQNQFKSRS